MTLSRTSRCATTATSPCESGTWYRRINGPSVPRTCLEFGGKRPVGTLLGLLSEFTSAHAAQIYYPYSSVATVHCLTSTFERTALSISTRLGTQLFALHYWQAQRREEMPHAHKAAVSCAVPIQPRAKNEKWERITAHMHIDDRSPVEVRTIICFPARWSELYPQIWWGTENSRRGANAKYILLSVPRQNWIRMWLM